MTKSKPKEITVHKRKQTRLVGMNLSRMNVSLQTINRIIADYKSLNQAAETALLNWYKVREIEIQNIKDALTKTDRNTTIKKLELPDNCSPGVLIAIAEDNGLEYFAERLYELSETTAIVLIDIINKKHFDVLKED